MKNEELVIFFLGIAIVAQLILLIMNISELRKK